MQELTILAIYAGVGAFSGVIAGMMGVGGGIVIVPALLFLFIWQGFPADLLMHMAVATSLMTIVFTALSSTWAHHRKGAVMWRLVWLLTPGILVGSVIGAVVADYLPGDRLRIGFGIFECLVALQILSGINPSPMRRLPQRSGLLLTGGGIGALSTILGIGGGTLTVPFLLWCNVNIRNAVASSSACGLPIALAGAVTMVVTGWDQEALPDGATGYIYWPAAVAIAVPSVLFAPLGARLAHRLPVATLRRIFALFLAIIGIRVLM